jgi:hypothetical protein
MQGGEKMESTTMTPEQMQMMGGGILAVLGGIFLLVILVFSVIGGLCVANIAKKLGMSFWTSFIMAIIPIANMVLLAQMARKPIWWIVLMLIPLVNIVIFIIVWMAIAENMGKPSWWGVMLFIPIVGLVFFLMLVFADAPKAVPAK